MSAVDTVDKWIFDIGKKALKPESILTVSEWAEEYRDRQY